MRITNEDYGPDDVIAELFSYRRVRKPDTKKFEEDNWCSHDWLIERLQARLDVVLESFRRLGCDVMETQSLRDHGVDIRLRLSFKGKHKVIGIQVKSNNEAEKDRVRPAGSETLAGTLKRQAYEAMTKASVDEWWLILCFDKTKHSRRISNICAELVGGPGDFPVTIWQPEKALSLLQSSEPEIDAACIRLLCHEDEVLREALSDARSLSNAALNIVLGTMDDALHGDVKLIQSVISDLARGDDEPINAVEQLERCGYIAWRADLGMYTVDAGALPGLCALYFEGRVRHRLSRDEAKAFVDDLVRV